METIRKRMKMKVQDSTKVEQVDVNIDEMFGMPGAENVMLPADEEETKNYVF
jgi:preprotein translocase subunit Sec63